MGTLGDSNDIRRLSTALCALAVMLVAIPALAQAHDPTTLEAAIEHYFAAESTAPAVVALNEAGFRYNRLLVAETLPSERAVFVEVELGCQGDKIRYPLKFERRTKDDTVHWKLSWAPAAVYAQTLADVARHDKLAKTDTGSEWAEIQRLPAFPIIVGPKSFVTPYGRVSATKVTPPPGAKNTNEPATSQLAPPKELAKHAQRWIGLTMEDDPGSANVDLLIEQKTSWTRVTQALMAPASLGLFRVYLVGRADGNLVAYAAAAPVIRRAPAGTEPLVVGMYHHGKTHAFRVRLGTEVVADSKACADNMTFCADTLTDFQKESEAHITDALAHHKTKVAYVMMAATGDFPAAEVVPYLAALDEALGLPDGKIFMGYIASQ